MLQAACVASITRVAPRTTWLARPKPSQFSLRMSFKCESRFFSHPKQYHGHKTATCLIISTHSIAAVLPHPMPRHRWAACLRRSVLPLSNLVEQWQLAAAPTFSRTPLNFPHLFLPLLLLRAHLQLSPLSPPLQQQLMTTTTNRYHIYREPARVSSSLREAFCSPTISSTTHFRSICKRSRCKVGP